MRWNRGQMSQNVDDMRGASGGGGFRGGGGGMRLGLGGMLLLLVLSVVFKRDFFQLVGGAGGMPAGAPTQVAPGPVQASAAEDELAHFVSAVLDSTQGFWQRELPRQGARYHDARLVLFRDAIQSACGFAESATGPFYCPGDSQVYIDLGFYDELRQRFGAPGDFAQAYVLAHEIGHHVQNLLGIEQKVRQAQQRRPDRQNQLSVLMELQADCLAGVWGHDAAQRGMLEAGDVEEGLGAAAAVGDDRLQKMATGHVSPEGFTHGTSAQRMRWFREGFDSGDLNRCDTFGAANP